MASIHIIVGSDSGLGQALIANIITSDDAWSDENVIIEVPGSADPDGFDFADEDGIYSAADYIRKCCAEVDPDRKMYRTMTNCIGVNYIEWFPEMNFSEFDRLMNLNVRSHLQLIQALIAPKLHAFDDRNVFESKAGYGCVCEIVSNASHMPMTNSAFYNATKGAQHIATLSLARELRKTHGLCVFGVAPNKLEGTGMSQYIEDRVPSLRGWSPEEAAQYQLNALPAEEETDPDVLGEFIAFLLSHPMRHKFLTNTIIPYGA